MPKYQTWNDEFRPTSISQCILRPRLKEPLARLEETGGFQHMLFTGPPGSGKTSVARIIGAHPSVIFKVADIAQRPTSEFSLTVRATFVSDEIALYQKSQRNLDEMPVAELPTLAFVDQAQLLGRGMQDMIRSWIDLEDSPEVFLLALADESCLNPILKSKLLKFDFAPRLEEYADLMQQARARCRAIAEWKGFKLTDDEAAFIVDSTFPDYRMMVNELFRLSLQITV